MIKDVVIMMARGIEGCGVTKFSLEQNKWFNNNGIRSTLIASSDKKWSRKTAHDCDVIQSFLFANDQEADAIIKKCNEVDVVIITSLPSRQYHNSKGHPIGCIDNFKRIISSIKTPIVSGDGIYVFIVLLFVRIWSVLIGTFENLYIIFFS